MGGGGNIAAGAADAAYPGITVVSAAAVAVVTAEVTGVAGVPMAAVAVGAAFGGGALIMPPVPVCPTVPPPKGAAPLLRV